MDTHGRGWMKRRSKENRLLAAAPGAPAAEVPDDVRRLGIAAIAAVRAH